MPTYAELLAQLPSSTPLTPPSHPLHPHLTALITSLQLHPALETALHLLNADLPSAHFLARHMQAPPALEGMYLHGLLHRVEGDMDNARAWFSDVADADDGDGMYARIWGKEGKGWKELGKPGSGERRAEKDAGQVFLDDVQSGADVKGRGEREMKVLLKWCEDKFGTERMLDAREAWVRPGEEVRKMGEGQVSGDDGRRTF